MTQLLLARHGQTARNAEGRYQGQTDIPLNDVGRQQAQALARRLAQTPIAAIYASDLQRARETAEAIAAPHGLPVRIEPRLREINFGAWEGLTHEEIKGRDPEQLTTWYDDPLHTSPPGGETLIQVAERVEAALEDIIQAHPDETVLIVAHGGTLRLTVCLALDVSPGIYWQFDIDVASLSEINVYEEKAILNALNDVAHLAGQSPPAKELEPRKGKLTLILGGARSGKSDFAQRVAEENSSDVDAAEAVLFVATAEAGDEEMRQRIEKHRQERPAAWHTLEAPRDAGRALLKYAKRHEPTTILLDCMTVLTSNQLMTFEEDPFADEAQERLMREIEAIVACAEQVRAHLIVVSNEVGLGLVPPYPLGRAYRDLLGRANQRLAEVADEVYLLVAGIPRQLKG